MDVTTPSSASQAKARAQGRQSFIISSRSGLLTFYIEGLCAVKVSPLPRETIRHADGFVFVACASVRRCARREAVRGSEGHIPRKVHARESGRTTRPLEG